MRTLRVLAFSVLAVCAMSNGAEAVPLVLNLNCVIGNNNCTASDSYGQIIISQVDAATVNILVDLMPLATAGGQKVLDIYLNYGGLLPDSAFSISAATSPTRLLFGEDPDPFHADFAINVDPRGQSFDPYNTNLRVNTGTLSVTDFDFADSTFGLLYGAVHIGACGPNSGTCEPGRTGTNSIKAGSLGEIASVPEPATLSVMGIGLLLLTRGRTRRS